MAETIVQQPGAVTSQAQFQNIPGAEVERSTFDRSHGWKGTLPRAGKVYPILVDEYMPGDTFSMKATAFVRLSTPLKPIMDRLHVDMHFFCCANRLVYEDFPNLMGERKSLDDSPDNYSVPTVTIDLTDFQNEESLADYFGLPMGQLISVQVSALPFRAYNLIWNEWYRDQNISEPLNLATQPEFYIVRNRAKRKDYFTSCLPWPQKGDPVIIPIGDKALVGFYGVDDPESQPGTGADNPQRYTSPDGTFYRQDPPINDLQPDIGLGTNQAYADLSEATSTSINDLRTAFQIQKLLERDARSGTRYVEITLAHFAVISDDRRQFRPEFLGGGSAVMQTVPVANTTGTAEQPQGELSAVGTGLCTASWSHSFTEHGLVMGMISIRSDLTYQNGIEKMWLRRTRYDFYWPVFAHLGEQAVKNIELYVAAIPADNDAVFGYQERWAEYRYKPSRIVNQFRSKHPSSLDVWHLAQDFDALPTLGEQFRRDNPPVDRIVAVPDEPHFIADIWFDYKCTRPMPVYGVPGLVDHF